MTFPEHEGTSRILHPTALIYLKADMIKTIEIAPDMYSRGLAEYLEDHENDFMDLDYDPGLQYSFVKLNVDKLYMLIKEYMNA